MIWLVVVAGHLGIQNIGGKYLAHYSSLIARLPLNRTTRQAADQIALQEDIDHQQGQDSDY